MMTSEVSGAVLAVVRCSGHFWCQLVWYPLFPKQVGTFSADNAMFRNTKISVPQLLQLAKACAGSEGLGMLQSDPAASLCYAFLLPSKALQALSVKIHVLHRVSKIVQVNA